MPTSKSGNAVVRNMKMQPWRNPCWGDLVQLRQKPQKNDFNGLNSERNEVSASSHGSLVHAFLLLAGFLYPLVHFSGEKTILPYFSSLSMVAISVSFPEVRNRKVTESGLHHDHEDG